LFIRRLKINHKTLWSHAFILEDGTAANTENAGEGGGRARPFFYQEERSALYKSWQCTNQNRIIF
jgi:hypothetical protein